MTLKEPSPCPKSDTAHGQWVVKAQRKVNDVRLLYSAVVIMLQIYSNKASMIDQKYVATGALNIHYMLS